MAGESDTTPAQKRPRDYGEELKGLTPERDSDQDGSSTPTRKKLRTDHSPIPDIAGALGDGDVNALGVPQNTEPSVTTAAEPGSAPSPSDVPDPVSANEPLQGDELETPASQGPLGWNRGVPLGTRTSFGKPKEASATPPTQSLLAKPTVPSVAPMEDCKKSCSDDGYSEGEVGEDDESAGDEDTKQMLPATSNGSPDGQPTDTDKANRGSGYFTFRVNKKDWKLPKNEIRTIKWNSNAQTKYSWWIDWFETELDYLIALLKRTNPEKPVVGPRVVESALNHILHHRCGYFIGASRKQNKQAKAEAIKAISSIDGSLWDYAVARAQWRIDNQDFSAPGETQIPIAKPAKVPDQDNSQDNSLDNSQDNGDGPEAAAAIVMDEEEEARQLELYFPRIGDVQVTCLHCVGTQHRSENCPSLRCGFCQSDTHMSYACPAKKRCSKCYQLGHGVESCQEKLSLTKDERPGCAYCSVRGHLEDRCPTIWRSYQPGLIELKKVKDIPCYCYMCGSAGHYGPECGLSSKKQVETMGWTTWSKANRDSYVDPESPDTAIAQVGVVLSSAANGVSDFHIKGKATKKAHIHFISSDESEGEFIQPPVSRGGRGEIRIATNIVNPSQQQQQSGRPRRNRNGQPPPPGAADMPPLPPGPPPPLGPNGGSQRSYHPLPPRPGGNSNGGRGGGYRGRGRTGNRGGRR